MKILLTFLSASFALSNIGSAALLYHYKADPGSPNPTTQGWTPQAFAGGVTAGGINDGGTPAWFVNDKSTTGGGFYGITPTAGDLTAAATLDWQLSVTLRVVNPSQDAAGALMTLFRGNGKSYQMHFGSTAGGDAIVLLADGTSPTGGATYTIAGSDYHKYDLNYSQSASNASLYVDGTLVGTPYTGFAFATDLIAWGSGSSADTGTGNYAEASFSVVPEPSAFVVGLLCFLVFGFCRIRHAAIA